MTYSDIKQQLMDGTTDSVYVFDGEEIEVQNAYIRRIAESKKQTIQRIDAVSEISKSKGIGLFGGSICYVCHDDAEFQKSEAAWGKIEGLLKGNTLIYIAMKVDKRSKFYTAWGKQIVTFDHMADPVLIKHIREHIDLTKENCKKLIHICEHDYGRILSEVDKVTTLMSATQAEDMPNNTFELMLADGTIYQPPEDVIFDWVNAMLKGKPRLSFELLEDCKAIGEPTVKLLTVLYQGIRRLLQVQSCEVRDISKNTGLTSWEINLVKDCVGVYDTIELVHALQNIRQLEKGIKLGTVDEEFAVPCAMISLLGGYE